MDLFQSIDSSTYSNQRVGVTPVLYVDSTPMPTLASWVVVIAYVPSVRGAFGLSSTSS
jgi:hypothetical protein